VQDASGVRAVEVRNVLGDARAEPVEVEMCVARDQGVERPEHCLDADRTHQVALVVLQLFAELLAPRFFADGQHVGPVDRATIAHARQPEHESQHSALRVECAGGHAADFLGDAENRCGHAVRESGAPDLILEGDGLVVLVVGGQRAEDDAVRFVTRAWGERRLLH
jgi:hypothetical protein